MTLLPCPFCGEVPGFSRRQDEDLTTHNIVWWDQVYCMNCDVGFSWPEHHETTAMKQWNTRWSIDRALAEADDGQCGLTAKEKDNG